MTPAIRFDNVTLGYDRHPAVHHLSGDIAAGALLAIVGPNGAGKSTLVKAIAGLIKPLQGSITLSPGKRARVAYLPQASAIDPTFPIDITDFVGLGLWREIGLTGRITAARAARVHGAIKRVGLEGYERRGLETLSGGQLQRALFARLVVQDPEIVVLDEPFAAIDRRTTEDLCTLLGEWHREGRTTLAVLHNLEQVRSYFPQTLLIAREVVAWNDTRLVLTEHHLNLAEQRLVAFDDDAVQCALPGAAVRAPPREAA